METPFIPDTNIQWAWDSTMLGDLIKCPHYYYLRHICGWEAKEENVHLRFGSEYHRALQNYDIEIAAGIKPDDAIFDVVRELMFSTQDFDSSHETKTRQNLVRTAIWHMYKYRDDPAKTLRKADGTPAVELSFKYEMDWKPHGTDQPYTLCGHMDRAAEYQGGTFIVDYKTTSYQPTPWFFKRYDHDNQMSFYYFAGSIVLKKELRGVLIDAVKIEENTSTFARGITTRSKDRSIEWLEELAYWFAIQQQLAEADRWPHDWTSCDKFGGCVFRDVCTVSPSLRQNFLEANFIQRPKEERWNPLKSR